MLQAAPLPISFEVPALQPLPPIPESTPLPAIGDPAPEPHDALSDAISDATAQDRPTSLAALVRTHSSSQTLDREQECLAGAVYFESKGEPLDGQLAVAKVIMNRTLSGRFAKSLCGVVMQRGQFSFIRGGVMPAIQRTGAHWKTAVAIAHIAENSLWQPTAANALYFHAKRVAPSWRMTRVASIGNHVFYR
jgi:spore germination cell wall hydrolase CwlJ-like protein